MLSALDAKIKHQRAMHHHALRGGMLAHLLDQARLSDARLAANVSDLAALTCQRCGQDFAELPKLRFAADEGAAAGHRLGADAEQAPHADRVGDALELHLAGGLAHAAAGQRAMHGIRDQRLAGGGHCNQARRKVHGIAEHCVVVRVAASERAGEHLTRGDADMGLQVPSLALAHPGERRMNLECGARRAQRIVVMGDRCTEQRHDGVADMLVHGAAERSDDAVDESRVGGHDCVQFLGVERLRQRRKAREVREQDRDQPPLAGWRTGNRRGRGRTRSQCLDGGKKSFAVAERADAQFSQVSVR